MESKYKIGDIIRKKNTRDTQALEIVAITYDAIEPTYKLQGTLFKCEEMELGESALEEFYVKI